MVYVFLAEGFEEIEALTVTDILRRAKIKVCTVSLSSRSVTGAHGITVTADSTINNCNLENPQVFVLPGGMPGTKNLLHCDKLRDILISASENHITLAAICAAPSVLGNLNLLTGRSYTCYPGFESNTFGGNYTKDKCITDKNGDFTLITASGPASASDFSFAIVNSVYQNNEVSKRLFSEMQF